MRSLFVLLFFLSPLLGVAEGSSWSSCIASLLVGGDFFGGEVRPAKKLASDKSPVPPLPIAERRTNVLDLAHSAGLPDYLKGKSLNIKGPIEPAPEMLRLNDSSSRMLRLWVHSP